MTVTRCASLIYYADVVVIVICFWKKCNIQFVTISKSLQTEYRLHWRQELYKTSIKFISVATVQVCRKFNIVPAKFEKKKSRLSRDKVKLDIDRKSSSSEIEGRCRNIAGDYRKWAVISALILYLSVKLSTSLYCCINIITNTLI